MSIDLTRFNALRDKLQESRTFLNINSNLTKSILRLYEIEKKSKQYCPLRENLDYLKRKALTLQNKYLNLMSCDDGSLKAFPAVEDEFGFKGASCRITPATFTNNPPFKRLPLSTHHSFIDWDDYNSQISSLWKQESTTFAGALTLGIGEFVDSNVWIVDQDSEDHVTIAVCSPDGIPVVEDKRNKSSIPALNNLNWQLLPHIFMYYRGAAEWRDDYFPESEEWTACVTSFNLILQHGGLQDFFEVCRLYNMLHSYNICENAIIDITEPLRLALSVILSYLDSDKCDPNCDSHLQTKAINFLRKNLSPVPVSSHTNA